MATPLPDKRFFKIGEVAALVGVKTHVLRYWESELGTLKPLKTRGAHRMYRREDVELFCRVRALLQDEGLTLAAAKKRLSELKRTETAPLAGVVRPAIQPSDEPRGDAARALSLRAELLHVRAELAALLASLDAPVSVARDSALGTATVTAVVPKTVLMQRTLGPRRT